MHPSFGVEREYRLLSDQPVSDTFLRDYERGITIDGVRYTAKRCRRGGPLTVTITLLEGKNREIRRVCAAGGVRITRLIRQRIGCVGLAGIARGKYRHLTIPEIDWFSPRASAQP
jgi:23S rRNA pseudouridine2605 synthase